ncbi:MAG: DNA polymerase IV [Firmicutes bacterium ADurb.Bin182]|nr:MAG: DNA polymerase IV [Firmicutes bacterium ADurb.Bin182]
MQRIILHADFNAFYASVECLHRVEIRDKPVAVAGDPDKRHGIILTKNQYAKSFGIKTGEAIWQAKQKAPGLIVVPPNYPLYLKFARMGREIYARYSSQIEPFGLDEAWIDISSAGRNMAEGEAIAQEIRERVRDELGITVSVGVSFNKVFAKLGSDLKKPDAVTVITGSDYKDKIWPLPAGELLYVGRSTNVKLRRYGMQTIGDIANARPELLKCILGKWGLVLHDFANGLDDSPVAVMDCDPPVKSIGNSCTTPRDMCSDEDVKLMFYVLSESVAARLREGGFLCKTVQIGLRDSELYSFERQCKLRRATDISSEIAGAAFALFSQNYSWRRPLRSIGVRAADLTPYGSPVQLTLTEDESKREKKEKLERAIDDIRQRFGHFAIERAIMLKDSAMGSINPKEEHVIHPVGFF